jgi:BCCT family betaine/carnitine transporter
MALTFLMFILILGPTKEILILTYSAFKELAINFAGMNTLGIIEKSKFADDWSIFYWAWWLALGPQVGLFVARVSKGRSLREVILGMLILGSLGCTLFFAIMGNYAINLELSGQMEVSSILANEGHQVAATKVILSLPFGKVFLFTYCLIVVIFIATSYDSVSYILASHIRKTGINYSEPTRSSRLFWASVLAIIPACLFIIGSNRTAMDLILLMSPPILILSPIFVFSMVKTLRNHYH